MQAGSPAAEREGVQACIDWLGSAILEISNELETAQEEAQGEGEAEDPPLFLNMDEHEAGFPGVNGVVLWSAESGLHDDRDNQQESWNALGGMSHLGVFGGQHRDSDGGYPG